jgi:hypothetical protein
MVDFVFSPDTSTLFIISQFLTIIVSLFLVALAVRAWKNTKLKKIIYVALAFALFAVIHIVNYIDMAIIDLVADDVKYLIFAIIQIVIMLLFVVAILKKS